MRTKGVTNTIISAVRSGVDGQVGAISKRPFDGASIQNIEKDFFKTIGESGSCGLRELLLQNDEPKTIIIHDGQKHYRKYLSVGRYLTLLGTISLRRGVYQSNKAKHSICPLELNLRFINDHVSFAAAEYICYSMATMTLGEFVKHCKKWALMKPSEGTVKRVLEYVGEFMETDDFLEPIRYSEKVSRKAVTLVMSMDSTCVLIRDQGWKHATAATVSTYDNKGNRLDTSYIGRMPEQNKGNVKKMLEKEVEAKQERHRFKNLVCIADGAREIWRYFQRKYPNAIHVLDYFHACEHISTLSELLFTDSQEAKAWFKKYRRILKEEPDGASKLIRAARYRKSLIKRNSEIESEIKYLQHNRKKMNYFELRRNSLPIGSGVIEAACKNLIGARMKKSGMRWTIEGGQTVLTLRSLILSGRWEKFWSHFMQRHFPETGT